MNLFKEEEKETLRTLRVLYSRRTFIAVFTITCGILAFILSFFVLPKKYQSEAIIYPTPSNSDEMILENPSFGFEGHANQLLQVLRSNTLKDRLIRQFELADYYEIDTTEPTWYSKLVKKMEKDIEFEVTPYYSVSITAETEDPELSANIVNFITNEVNVLLEEIFRENIRETFEAYKREYLSKEDYVNKLLDSLILRKEANTSMALSHLTTQMEHTYQEITRLRKRMTDLKTQNAIYSYDEQMRLLSNQLANASAHYNHSQGQYNELKEVLSSKDTTLLKLKGEMLGARKNADTARVQLEKLKSVNSEYAELNLLLQQNLDRYVSLQGQIQNLKNAYEPTISSAGLDKLKSELLFSQEQLQELKTLYERARNRTENKLPSIYVISRGRPVYQKSSPSHTKNILFGFLAGLLFSTGWVLLNSRWTSLKLKLKEPA